jgi:UDP-N-acetylmuramyl pentapeptide synthase
MMRLQQALGWLPGVRLVGDASVQVLRVNSDTRSLQAGDLFVALEGERFDAHEFLAQARARGAVAAIAHHGLEAGRPAGPGSAGHAPGTGAAGGGLALAVQAAAGGGDGAATGKPPSRK